MVTRINRRIQNAECADVNDPNALPIVSGRDTVGGMTTVMTAAIIDGDRVFFDEAATHGRTALEQSIEWLDDLAEVPNPRQIFVVWLFIKPDRETREYVYHGVCAVDMWIDEENKKGFKRLAHHAKMLGMAMRGQIDLEILDKDARMKLHEALNQYPDTLKHSQPALREALAVD